MESGLLIRWGKLVDGREHQGMDLFAEALTYFGGKLAKGQITYFEPFLFNGGEYEYEQGFFVVKGPKAEIDKIVAEEEFNVLTTKAILLAKYFEIKHLYVGDDVLTQVGRINKVLADLGI
jgi:hypothetical protein